MTIKEIMDFCPSNEMIYDELLRAIMRGSIVPFVGAGLSYPIYPLWNDTLNKLSSFVFNPNSKEELLESIGNGKYIEVADKLEHIRGKHNLARDLLFIFSEQVLDNKIIYLSEMSVFMLPKLFPDGPIVTTNFDRIIERVYNSLDKRFEYVLTPQNIIAQTSLQQNLHTLYKIHGDIGKNTIDYSQIVFTGNSYEGAYSDTSGLVNELSAYYQGKSMLFLGCSLHQDRTLDLLKKVVNGSNSDHYAILPIKHTEDIDARIKFLGDYHIRTIFYPETDHSCVKCVLNSLIERMEEISVHSAARVIERDRIDRNLQIHGINTSPKKEQFVYSVFIMDDEKEQLEMLSGEIEALANEEGSYTIRILAVTDLSTVMKERDFKDIDVFILDAARKGTSRSEEGDKLEFFGSDLMKEIIKQKPLNQIKSKFYVYSRLEKDRVKKEFIGMPAEYRRKQTTSNAELAKEVKDYLDCLFLEDYRKWEEIITLRNSTHEKK